MLWLNLILFAMLLAGHTELMVTLVNRVHSLPIHCRMLRQLRHLHDAAILLFPVVLVAAVGVGGPGLLLGGSWADLPLGWTIYCGLCALGFAGLLVSSARWWLRTVPAALLANDSRTLDVAKRLGFRPIAEGPFRFLTRVPGNEIFRLEVSEKTYRLPRLPREWDGLSILHLSDLHYIGTIDRPFFDEVIERCSETPADLIVFTGDLLDRQHLTAWLPETLGKLSARLGCFFILGNHDWDRGLDPDEIRRVMGELGWQEAAGKVVNIDAGGRPIAIGGTELPWMGTHPDFSAAGDDAFRLLLSHTPDNLPWARRQRVDLMLAGHNHGGQVVLPVIGPVYSPSRYGVRYAGGAYWEEPTLLYVSRGISGRYPLRLNCPPELTRLVLRSGELDTTRGAAVEVATVAATAAAE